METMALVMTDNIVHFHDWKQSISDESALKRSWIKEWVNLHRFRNGELWHRKKCSRLPFWKSKTDVLLRGFIQNGHNKRKSVVHEVNTYY